jgi:hypothetical protein
MEMWVRNGGKSKCLLVMGRIRDNSLHESEQTSARSSITRKFVEPSQGEKQMNVKTCASPDTTIGWDNINWKSAELNVKRLQMRIVKAQKESRFNKVKCLQWLLTHSHYAKILAIKRITENQGKKDTGSRQRTMDNSANETQGNIQTYAPRLHTPTLKEDVYTEIQR